MKSRILTWAAGTARFHSLTAAAQLSLTVSLVLVLFAASASAAPLVYVVTVSQQFGTVDLANGHFQPIGSPTPDGMSNLMWWKDGSLLSLTTTGSDVGSLVKVNPATGEESVIGQTGLGFNAFDLGEVRGKLYLTDFSNNIYSIDRETGIATPIAATGMPPDPNIPFTYNDDGTFNLCDEGLYSVGGKLYATFDSYAIDPTQNPPTIAHVWVSPALYQIDPFTGAATFLAQTDLQLGALVEVDGKFYAFRQVITGFADGFPLAHSQVVTLDLKTGKTNPVSDVDAGPGPVFGAAPVHGRR